MINVRKGEKLDAGQFNTLAYQSAGLYNPSTNTVFRRTSDGMLINSHTQINTVPQKQNDVLFQLNCGQGMLSSVASAGEALSDKGMWHGIWMQGLPWGTRESGHYFYHQDQNIGLGQYFNFVIDPTDRSNPSLQLVNFTADKYPLCDYNRAAACGVFLASNRNLPSHPSNGSIVAVFGDWSVVTPGVQGWEVCRAWQTDRRHITDMITGVLPDFTDFRLLGSYTLVDNIRRPDTGFIPVNVGQMHIESMPDSMEGLSSSYLSSFEFTPATQLGFTNNGRLGTWSYSLYNFHALDADYTSLSAMRHANHPDGSPAGSDELSSFDILVKHKYRHPLANAGEHRLDNNAIARLEYVPLAVLLSSELSSGCISGDCNVIPETQSSIETKTSQGKQWHQLYNWDGDGYDDEHVLCASFGQVKYFSSSQGGTADTSRAARMLTESDTLPKELHYDIYGIRIPKVDVRDITDEFHDWVLSSAGIDKDTVTQWIIEAIGTDAGEDALTDQLDDQYWKQGGSNTDCYGSSIGNSTHDEVVSLDGTMLQAPGTNSTALDWSLGRCTDSDGNAALNWSNRELQESGGAAVVMWENQELYSPTGQEVTLDWDGRQLKGNWSVNQGNFTIGGGYLKIGNTILTENQLQQLLRLI